MWLMMVPWSELNKCLDERGWFCLRPYWVVVWVWGHYSNDVAQWAFWRYELGKMPMGITCECVCLLSTCPWCVYDSECMDRYVPSTEIKSTASKSDRYGFQPHFAIYQLFDLSISLTSLSPRIIVYKGRSNNTRITKILGLNKTGYSFSHKEVYSGI